MDVYGQPGRVRPFHDGPYSRGSTHDTTRSYLEGDGAETMAQTKLLKRVWIPSPNKSTRTSSVRLVVVHTTEGARTYDELGNFFANPSVQASSHVGIDDQRGIVGEYVHRMDKAWAVAAYNSSTINAELCAFADWSTEEWFKHPNMLANLADWIREECLFYGIPVVKLTDTQAQGNGRGICGHIDLGVLGGGHHDPGPNFPWEFVLGLVKAGLLPAHPPYTVGIAAVTKADGTITQFVETKTGEIFRSWQDTVEGDIAVWSKWKSMGIPGK